MKARKRERVRCSPLVDWPVYPRLILDYGGGLAVSQLAALGDKPERAAEPSVSRHRKPIAATETAPDPFRGPERDRPPDAKNGSTAVFSGRIVEIPLAFPVTPVPDASKARMTRRTCADVVSAPPRPAARPPCWRAGLVAAVRVRAWAKHL